MSSTSSGLSPGHGLVTRGLLVAALFATTFAIYGASALFSELVLGHAGRPALWLLMLATFMVAVVLPPVRRRVEPWVNRLILGQRADAYELMTDVVSRMANTLAVDDVLPRLAEAAARSVRSQRGEVRLWLAGGGESRQEWTAAGIRARPARVDGPGLTVEVQHHGASVGEIGVDTETGMAAAGNRLLRELAAPAGLALSTVRLTLELRERLEQVAALNDQLRASQDRLVNARRIEQQRIQAEVDLRVRPRLDAVDAALVAAGDAGTSGAKRLESLVAAARSGAVGALDALRGLATGIYPPRLAQAGLFAALEAWAERTGFRLKLAENQSLERIRSSPSVEAAVYFVCVTALGDLAGTDETQPDLLAVADASEFDDRLRFSLLVRGRSGCSPVLGPETVQVLQDRIDALGGEIAVQTEPESTTISGWLPLAAEPPKERLD